VQRLLLQAYERDRWDAEALAIRRQWFDASPTNELRHATSPYREALALAERAAHRLPEKQRAVWPAALREQFKAKRNFVAVLPQQIR
jgi:hypothetical protein